MYIGVSSFVLPLYFLFKSLIVKANFIVFMLCITLSSYSLSVIIGLQTHIATNNYLFGIPALVSCCV